MRLDGLLFNWFWVRWRGGVAPKQWVGGGVRQNKGAYYKAGKKMHNVLPAWNIPLQGYECKGQLGADPSLPLLGIIFFLVTSKTSLNKRNWYTQQQQPLGEYNLLLNLLLYASIWVSHINAAKFLDISSKTIFHLILVNNFPMDWIIFALYPAPSRGLVVLGLIELPVQH